MQAQIALHKISLYAYHGCLEQERIVGNNYEIDIRVWIDASKAVESDDVADTINYASIYEIVKQEMMIPSNLLEHVAGRIIKSVKKEFSLIQMVEITIAKTPPPISGKIAAASVTIKS